MRIAYEATAAGSAALARSVDSQNAALSKAQRRLWMARWINWAGGLLFPFAVIAFLNRDDWATWSGFGLTARDLTVAAAISACWLAAWFLKGLVDRKAPPSVADRLIAQSRSSGYYGPVVLEVDGAGVRHAGSAFDIRGDWTEFERIDSESDPDYVILWSKFGWATVVPRSAFASGEDESFLTTAVDRLRSAQLRRSEGHPGRTIEFDQTIDDLAAIRRYYLRLTRGGRVNRVLRMAFVSLPAVVICGMFSLVLLTPWMFPSRGVALDEALPAMLGLACFFLAFAALPAFVAWADAEQGIRSWASRNVRRGKAGPYFLGRKRVTLAPGGVRVDGRGFDSFLNWRDIAKVVAEPHHLLILETHSPSDVRGFIVPRLAFAPEGDFVRFCATADENWRLARPAS